MSPRIVNLNTVAVAPLPPGAAPEGHAAEVYQPQVAMLGRMLGAEKLGYNLIELAPGKRGFPFHSHRTNEEVFVILSGEGEIRLGADRRGVRAGDLIAALAGGPETAHQITNTGAVPLRYLALSTCETPDVVEYPDTGRFRVMDVPRLGDDGFDVIQARGSSLGYWDVD
ncbi:cupin domain-containing protein [Brevundimonas sp.]|uniref:cupin domain-containing protein n=1 Tax=Brevundimonas sp. TaxID=1871086 RepID=UPI003D6D33A6